MKHIRVLIFMLMLAMLGGPAHAEPFDPPALYLTWQQDPTTTMTVQWHTLDDSRPSELAYRQADDHDAPWQQAIGEHWPFPHTDRFIHAVEIVDLEPNTDYLFRFTDAGPEYRFRTMPADASEPVVFVVGGDLMHRRTWMEIVNEQMAAREPMFAVLGGDLAYEDGHPDKVDRLFDFFEAWKNTAVTPDGRIIPMIPLIGNHEVDGGWQRDRAKAPFFYDLFTMPGWPGYATLDFGDYLSLIILDSGHIIPVDGEQSDWLDQQLAERRERGITHVFPVYHVPAYPSVRHFYDGRSRDVRNHWPPIFDKHDVDIAFENHDHAYKRTHRLRDGQVDPTGTLYVGDGAWGVQLRPVKTGPEEEVWYLDEAHSIHHVIIVTLHEQDRWLEAIDNEGKTFDRYPPEE
ncbi:fibronectin type III domain-containing protein [Phycisphaerales bacterium AB-hyl4]|uniref:Fibronectin type III domain-containing protein n=1 Tax=Natronomicrosphaera hydrolytica TaxID=3242702 RepID=A0ABV4U6K7_9BACT